MSGHAEQEIKLGSWAGFRLPSLDGVLEGVSAVALPDKVLHATYYDTADLRLARWGVTLRYRTGDATTDGAGKDKARGAWTLKLPREGDGDHGALLRKEVVCEGTSSSVPDEAAALVQGYVRTSVLEPVARLRTRRRGIELHDGDGQRLAEVVDDEVSVLDGRRVAARFREIEIEFQPTAPDDLVPAVLDRLQRAGAGDADSTPKVVRALGSRALAPPEVAPLDLGSDPTMGEVVRTAVARSVARILAHEPGLRLGDDPEDIHQARVGTRRLRSDLRTFEAVVVDEWASPLRDELKWLGGLFGEVRDADVLLERLHRQAAELPHDDGPGVRSLLRRLGKERTLARRRLLGAMAEARYLQLLERLVKAANDPQLLPEADSRARAELPRLVSRPWNGLEKAVESLPENPPDADLHRVRIKAKRARYAAEAAAPVIGAPATALGKALSDLQDVLGDHQDAVVAEDWLREAANRAGPERALVAGELIGAQRAEAAACRAEWRAVWDKASKKKLRAWLS